MCRDVPERADPPDRFRGGVKVEGANSLGRGRGEGAGGFKQADPNVIGPCTGWPPTRRLALPIVTGKTVRVLVRVPEESYTRMRVGAAVHAMPGVNAARSSCHMAARAVSVGPHTRMIK